MAPFLDFLVSFTIFAALLESFHVTLFAFLTVTLFAFPFVTDTDVVLNAGFLALAASAGTDDTTIPKAKRTASPFA